MSVYDALATKLATFAAGLSIPVSYPMVNFTPPVSGNWFQIRVFNNGNRDYALENGGASVDQGIIRIECHAHKGEGLAAIESLADQIAAEFAKGTKLSSGLVYKPCAIDGPFESDTGAFYSVKLEWRATR